MMLSLQPSPCRRASHFLHSSTQFPSRSNVINPRIFLVFDTNMITRSLRVQDLVETVKTIPSEQKLQYLEKIQRNVEIQTISLEKIQRNVEIETISQFNHALSSLVTADELEIALKMKSNLSSFGLVPNSWTYSILVNCYCKKNDPVEAKNILDIMLSNGFKPSVATFTTLINSFCQSGRMRDAFEVFDIMSSTGCEPTINTYNCLLKGLCYVGKVEEAYDLLINIKSMKPDIYTYTAVMDGFCKVGRSNEALELLDEAILKELTPNVVTYNTLLNGYFKEGRPLCGISLLNRMKAKNCEPDCISYSTLLHGLLKWGKFRAALRIYREMVEIGLGVDERMMNTLLRGLCRRSRREKELIKDVCDLFDEMKKGNHTVYACAYDLVIVALTIGKEIEKAFVVLKEMVEIGFSPRTFTFNIVIQKLCLLGKGDEALAVLMLIHKDRKAGRIPFDALIDGLNQRGRSENACTVYGLALKRGVVPKKKPI